MHRTCTPFSPAAAQSTPFARFILHAHLRRPRPSTPVCPSPLRARPLIALCALVSSAMPKRRTRFVLPSSHDCDGHVYNVIRVCQTCHRSAVVHLKAIYHDGPVRCWRPAVALWRSVTLILQVLTRRCT